MIGNIYGSPLKQWRNFQFGWIGLFIIFLAIFFFPWLSETLFFVAFIIGVIFLIIQVVVSVYHREIMRDI